MQIRPMRRADAEDVGELAALTVDGEWRETALHLLEHDRAGCWVAEESGRVIGCVMSLRRETLWALSTLTADPEAVPQLLEAALTYSQGCVRGIVRVPDDPMLVRQYHDAGFTLHPAVRATGRIDRSALPVVEGVRAGAHGDLDLLESVDRQTRGAGHGVDHPFVAARHRLLVADNHLGSGYCYLAAQGGIHQLGATSERLAQRLVWEAMARSPTGEFTVRAITPEQDWLVDVVLQAGLDVRLDGYVGVRFMRPPWPYVPGAHFL